MAWMTAEMNKRKNRHSNRVTAEELMDEDSVDGDSIDKAPVLKDEAFSPIDKALSNR